MSTFKDLEAHISKNPSFLGELLNNPQDALKAAKIDLKSEGDVKRAEMFIRLVKMNINVASNLTDIRTGMKSDWGIGAGCCNSDRLASISVDNFRK